MGYVVCHRLFHICRGEAGGFEVILDLMLLPLLATWDVSCYLFTYADGNRWRVWAGNQATVVSLGSLLARAGRVCLAVGKDWRRNETRSRRVAVSGNPTSGELEERCFYDTRKSNKRG